MEDGGTARMETFSDGVFAIAATLLVLEIGVGTGADQHLGRALVDLWPSYLAYATSFLTIGIIWVNHHECVACMVARRSHHAVHQHRVPDGGRLHPVSHQARGRPPPEPG